MGGILRRLLPNPGQNAGAARQPPTTETVARLQSYHVERSTDMSEDQHDEPAAAPAAAMPNRQSSGFGDVGERVNAILQSAQDAADDIRAKAEEEAARIRKAADEDAAAKSQEAERRLEEERRAIEQLRPEADRYSNEVRKAADEYAAGKRREGEEHAARVRQQAEEAAKRIEEDATVHRKRLEEEAQALETWLEQAATAFKNVTGRLEALSSRRPEATEESSKEGEGEPSLEEALQPQTEYAQTE